jgi:hypothetical protein
MLVGLIAFEKPVFSFTSRGEHDDTRRERLAFFLTPRRASPHFLPSSCRLCCSRRGKNTFFTSGKWDEVKRSEHDERLEASSEEKTKVFHARLAHRGKLFLARTRRDISRFEFRSSHVINKSFSPTKRYCERLMDEKSINLVVALLLRACVLGESEMLSF